MKPNLRQMGNYIRTIYRERKRERATTMDIDFNLNNKFINTAVTHFTTPTHKINN